MLHRTRAFTLLETLMAVGIILMIGALTLASLNSFRAQKTMDAAVEELLAAFSQAHFDTISSKNDLQYGVHLDANQAVYYIGPSYLSGSTTNIIYPIPTVIEIANISLAGGGNNVLFQRLSGGTDQYGTFDVRVRGNPSLMTRVTINGTGAISL